MKNSKKILAALAALTVMTTVAGTNVFAAEKETEEAATTVAAEAEPETEAEEAAPAPAPVEEVKEEVKEAVKEIVEEEVSKDVDVDEVISIIKNAFDFSKFEFKEGPGMTQFIDFCRRMHEGIL